MPTTPRQDSACHGVATTKRLAANRNALNAVGLYGESAARRSGNGDGAGGTDGDLWLDNVLGPVAFGGGDIAG